MTAVVRDTVARRPAAGASAPAVVIPSRLRHPIKWRVAMYQLDRARERRQQLAWRVSDILASLDLIQYGHSLNCGSKGRNIYLPRIRWVEDGPPRAVIVEMLPGQILGDYQRHAARLGDSLGVARVRMTALTPPLLRFELLEKDPLGTTVASLPATLFSSADLLLLGVDDADTRYRIAPAAMGHTVIQGQTGSGKSSFLYWLLAELCSAPDVLIAMSDPTGLLARAFLGTIHEPWQVRGTGELDAHLDLLGSLVSEMDTRIATIPGHQDRIDPGPSRPLITVILEEYTGLLRAADDGTANRRSARVAEIHRRVARLVSEGRKAALRVVLVANRADATLVGGFERGQSSLRLSFRVDSADAIGMLHPSGRPEADHHATAPPGLALLSAPGVPLARIRTPFLGDPAYPTYTTLIKTRARRPS